MRARTYKSVWSSLDNSKYVKRHSENQIINNDKVKPSSSIKTSLINHALDSNCDFCDENYANESKSQECALEVQNREGNYRQTILSEYFPKQVVNQTPNEESKSDATVMINFHKLVSQLLNAKVIVERLPQSTMIAKLRPTLEIHLERLKIDQLKLKDEIEHLLYCYKCKTTHTKRQNMPARKKCQKCGTDLLYICNKCNEKFYPHYKHMNRHRKLCKGQEKSKGQGKSIMLHCCADCEFFTAFESSMKWHLTRKRHRVCGNVKLEKL